LAQCLISPYDRFDITAEIEILIINRKIHRPIKLTYGDIDLASFDLDRNLFWNAGNSLPTQGAILPAADVNRLVADPLLESDQGNVVLPVWDENQHQFMSGNTTIRQEFVRLVNTYGAIPSGSPARDSADAQNMPSDDILGKTRGASPDIGCFEYDSATGVTFEQGGNRDRDFMLTNAPNPFNGRTLIKFKLDREQNVRLEIYNCTGQRVSLLRDGIFKSGPQEIVCNPTQLNSGVYAFVITTRTYRLSCKCVVVK